MYLNILLLICSIGVFAQSKSDFPDWLKGVWEIKSDTGSSFEQWTIEADGIMSGRTFRYFSSDIVVFDTMTIRYRNSGIVFEMATNINKKREIVDYSLQRPDPRLWKFENLNADYPKNINYMRLATDSVYVWTEANDEKSACMDYLMIRIADE